MGILPIDSFLLRRACLLHHFPLWRQGCLPRRSLAKAGRLQITKFARDTRATTENVQRQSGSDKNVHRVDFAYQTDY